MSELQLIRPVEGTITQTFDQHVARAMKGGYCQKPQPAGRCPNGYYYGGIDTVTSPPIGCPVLVAADGNADVRNEGDKGYGLNVKVTHAGGYVTIYAHLSGTNVKPLRDVKAGDVIGYTGWSGNTWDWQGNHTPGAAHLHFELRKDGVPIDPMPYLTGAIVPPPPVEPPVVTPLSGKFVRVLPMTRPRLRTQPAVLPQNIIVEQLHPEEIFELVEEVESDGRRWAKVAAYIASEFVESVE
jgi:hypothetical protein